MRLIDVIEKYKLEYLDPNKYIYNSWYRKKYSLIK